MILKEQEKRTVNLINKIIELPYFIAVEDKTPLVRPQMNEFYLVSASADVKSAFQEPHTVITQWSLINLKMKFFIQPDFSNVEIY
jgi:hypothetical protein